MHGQGDGQRAYIAREIVSLNLHGNQLGADGGAAKLAAMLASNTSLTNLNLSYNYLGDAGAAALAPGLEANTTLTRLKIQYDIADIDDAARQQLHDAAGDSATVIF